MSYSEDLWFLMHHSDKMNRQSIAVTCYLDESATDGSTPIAVVGGLTLNKKNFLRLDKQWNRMIDKFNLHPALHMKDFGSHGRFGKMPIEDRRKILAYATKIIMDCNIFTIAVTVDHAQYRSILPKISESR